MAAGPGGGRRLRAWLVAQAESGRFPGLEWDDAARSALRIPWQHAGRGGARGGAGAALCKAWAEFKGRLRPGAPPDPAGWKTRLRCALNKSPELRELPERGRPDGPRPYRVYRLLPAPPARGSQPPKRGGARLQQGAAASGDGTDHGDPTPPPSPDEAPPTEPGPAPTDPAEAPPPTPLKLCIVLDSPEPLPPAQGDAALGVRLFQQGALCWQGWFPPGEFLLCCPTAPPPRPGLLPRLLLLPHGPPRPAADPPHPALQGLRAGLMVASAPRGLFLRHRGAAGGAVGRGWGVRCRAPHVCPTAPALRDGELVLAFDARRFRQEVGQHRAGLGPRPEHRVTLVVGQEPGPDDGTHDCTLVLQLEQAFAQQLLDGAGGPHTEA
ncbi:interferon regulatory factor 9-like [Nyctibius grandis]|uniref:interferon regulatory factor 9-like n=1 Tax=Nyctibius grandis TaxID=48427 RepID=UPI0035BC9390